MTPFPESTYSGSGHPTDEQLLAFLDSELSAAEMEHVRAHVNSCEACQAELASLKDVLGSFQELRNTGVAEIRAQQTDEVVETFRARLKQHLQEKLGRPVPAKPVPETRDSFWHFAALFRYRIPILASVVAVALVLAATMALRETIVSADTLLRRSEQRDALPSPSSPTISRSVLHILVLDSSTGKEQNLADYVLLVDPSANEARLQDASVTRNPAAWSATGNEFWGDLSAKAFAAQPYFDQALLRYMQKQNFFPDTAAAQFRKLVAGRGATETHVHKGESSYGLDYAFVQNHPSSIRNAILWVTNRSYDPFQLSIFAVNGSSVREFRVTRESRIFESRDTEDARLLSALPNSPVPSPNPITAHPPVLAPFKYGQIPASPSEVRATELLHKLNACLGEEVYVYPMPGGTILVQGLVDSSDRRHVLMNALNRADGSIHPEIFTPDQLRAGVHLFPSPYTDLPVNASISPASATEQSADLSGQQIAFHDELVANFQSEGKSPEEAERSVAAFSSELSTLSEKLLLNSWALERLNSEFPASRTAQLPKEDLDTLHSLDLDHRQQIHDLVHRELALLAHIPLPDTAASVQTTGFPHENLDLAKAQEKIVRALFTASQQNARKSESLSRLVQILRTLAD
jgi:hypothetical protein